MVQGIASLKGYEVNDDTGVILGKDSGKGTIYVNIVHGTDVFTVTSCVEDRVTDNVWRLGAPSIVDIDQIYVGANNEQIWDMSFFMLGMVFYPNVYTLPIFKVKLNDPFDTATKISFTSFACIAYDDTSPPNRSLGSCSISFKNIDPLKVPHGTNGCY